jgi:excisionase family DNA binding protein
LYTVEGAAAFLGGISKWTVHAWLAKGKLRRTKVGARTMIRESDLQAFIDACNAEPAAHVQDARPTNSGIPRAKALAASEAGFNDRGTRPRSGA